MKYTIQIKSIHSWLNAGIWCNKNIGKFRTAWDWGSKAGTLVFVNEKDAVMFALRWA